jgi:DNA-binding HxlR family transcriptional regulator
MYSPPASYYIQRKKARQSCFTAAGRGALAARRRRATEPRSTRFFLGGALIRDDPLPTAERLLDLLDLTVPRAQAALVGSPDQSLAWGLGDRWTPIVLRDMMVGGRRHFRELLTRSDEGISSNILADRLTMLLNRGMINSVDGPTHKQKGTYSLTETSIALVPIFAHLGAGGRRYLPVG